MFTGIVQAKGRIQRLARRGQGLELSVDTRGLGDRLELGESVALSGCCATVARERPGEASFELTAETLARTWFGEARPGMDLHLERALRLDSLLGGHLVQGHVDGLAEVVGISERRDGSDLVVALPEDCLRYCVHKGSISLDGISLTIAKLAGREATVALIPHTIDVTTFGDLRRGRKLHVEVDVLAKHVERLLAAQLAELRGEPGGMGAPPT